jgi:hypothetical protein
MDDRLAHAPIIEWLQAGVEAIVAQVEDWPSDILVSLIGDDLPIVPRGNPSVLEGATLERVERAVALLSRKHPEHEPRKLRRSVEVVRVGR